MGMTVAKSWVGWIYIIVLFSYCIVALALEEIFNEKMVTTCLTLEPFIVRLGTCP